MWPLNSSDDDRCTAHHWGKYTINWRRSDIYKGSKRVEGETIDCLFIQAEESRSCQHEGCAAMDYRCGIEYAIPQSILSLEVNVAELEDAIENLKEQ